MELVLLQDVQSSYASNWARVANTTGLNDVQIKDRFREQGFGPGSEELEVAGIDISPVGGFSRLFFNRGANATQPGVHRLGAVLEQVNAQTPQPIAEVAIVSGESAGPTTPIDPAPQTEDDRANATSDSSPSSMAPLKGRLIKKKRGRPIGSKNVPKSKETPVAVGFE